MSGNRLTRFLRRHGTAAPRMAGWALLRSLYCREGVRRCIRPWVRARHPQKWLFVVGCYNSGTTVTQQLLAAHPAIRTLPWEGTLITSVLANPEDAGWTRMWIRCPELMRMPDGQRPDLADRIVRDWSPWWGSGGTVFLEKSITNVTRMEWLDRHFPQAYFLGVTRNGYCASEGIRRKARPRPAVAKTFGTTYSLEMAGQQWVAANQSLRAGAQLVQRYHEIRYEDLMSQPARNLAEIWKFIGLPVPEVQDTLGGVRVNGREFQLQRETNRGSFSRLTANDIAQLRSVIQGEMERLRYPLDVEFTEPQTECLTETRRHGDA
ncbi:MAG: sulfotransferase [Planctomycetales bacterium]|nr:sulfotransferase [Planctomycetales bacterium]